MSEKTKLGYEIPSTRIFNEFKEVEPADEIAKRIEAHERSLIEKLHALFGKETRVHQDTFAIEMEDKMETNHYPYGQDNLTWTLRDFVLTISGTGHMEDFDLRERGSNDESSAPWLAGGRCELIQSIVIQDGVTSIGDFAFFGCTNLTDVTIPESVTEIHAGAFCHCRSLPTIHFPSKLKILGCGDLEGNCLRTWGAFEGCTHLSDVIIPDGVIVMGDSLFYSCERLHTMSIPDSVKILGEESFAYCTGMKELHIGDNVQIISESAFRDCSSLVNVVIPDSLTEIPNKAFIVNDIDNCLMQS